MLRTPFTVVDVRDTRLAAAALAGQIYTLLSPQQTACSANSVPIISATMSSKWCVKRKTLPPNLPPYMSHVAPSLTDSPFARRESED